MDCLFGSNDSTIWHFVQVTIGMLGTALYAMLLFAVLGSTADVYFTPCLSYLCNRFKLPPRFSGVTLLALGNGAADVSATITAITSYDEGYKMGLAALTGAAMFVSCIVSGAVIVFNDGVNMRGALIRDIVMLIITSSTLFYVGLREGLTYAVVVIFFAMYSLFVTIVLIADVYHRRRVYFGNGDSSNSNSDGLNDNENLLQNGGGSAAEKSNFDRIVTAMSNYDWDGRVSGWIQEDGMKGSVILKPSNSDEEGRQATDAEPTSDVTIGNTSSGRDFDYKEMAGEISTTNNSGLISHMELEPAHTCSPSNRRSHMSSLTEGLLDCCIGIKSAVKNHVNEEVLNPDLRTYEKVFNAMQAPYYVLRSASVCLTDDETDINRGLLVTSMIGSCFWIYYYFKSAHEYNVLHSSMFYVLIAVLSVFAVPVIMVDSVDELRSRPIITLPLSIYGFVIAAMWIDVIADQLVSVLRYQGLFFNIPTTVMGMTFLAWGNSCGDYAANIAMVKKGLANMSMTACFAGPVFNILIGLGAGFHLLLQNNDGQPLQIDFTPSIWVGLCFIIGNCALLLVVGIIFGRGRIPKKYGYFSGLSYGVYLLVAIIVEYSTHSNE